MRRTPPTTDPINIPCVLTVSESAGAIARRSVARVIVGAPVISTMVEMHGDEGENVEYSRFIWFRLLELHLQNDGISAFSVDIMEAEVGVCGPELSQ